VGPECWPLRCRAGSRRGDAAGIVCARLAATVSEIPVVHTDDTSWCVGREPAHLMAFETGVAMVYQTRPRHRHEEVQEFIRADYPGVMVTDRGRSHNAQAFDHVDQQKCLAHFLRSLSVVVEQKRGRAREFGSQLKTVLQDALTLWHRRRDHPVASFKVEAESLQGEITYHLQQHRPHDRAISGS
jgi:transposase